MARSLAIASAQVGALQPPISRPSSSRRMRCDVARPPRQRIVFNTMTGYASVRAAVSCSATDMFDIVLELQQDQKGGTASSPGFGTVTLEDVMCAEGSSSFTVLIAPQSGTFASGTATVTARIANYGEHVIPTEVRRRVRVTT